mgnify:FL=1
MRGILIWFAIGVVGFFLLILASADNEIGLFAWEPLTVLVFIFDILHIEFLALIEPTLFIIFILGILLSRRYHLRDRFNFSRPAAAIAFVLIAVSTGLVYETSLAFGPEGAGWDHYQGVLPFYIGFSLIVLFLIRRYCLTFQDVVILAGAGSFTESLLVGTLLTSLTNPLGIFLLAYYFLAYSISQSIPLFFINEKLLWHQNTSFQGARLGLARRILFGAIAGFLGYLIIDLISRLFTLLF